MFDETSASDYGDHRIVTVSLKSWPTNWWSCHNRSLVVGNKSADPRGRTNRYQLAVGVNGSPAERKIFWDLLKGSNFDIFWSTDPNSWGYCRFVLRGRPSNPFKHGVSRRSDHSDHSPQTAGGDRQALLGRPRERHGSHSTDHGAHGSMDWFKGKSTGNHRFSH